MNISMYYIPACVVQGLHPYKGQLLLCVDRLHTSPYGDVNSDKASELWDEVASPINFHVRLYPETSRGAKST